jgi:hypothetical protein
MRKPALCAEPNPAGVSANDSAGTADGDRFGIIKTLETRVRKSRAAPGLDALQGTGILSEDICLVSGFGWGVKQARRNTGPVKQNGDLLGHAEAAFAVYHCASFLIDRADDVPLGVGARLNDTEAGSP